METRSQPLQVAISINAMNTGGTELNAVRTVERFNRERIKVTVICLRPEGPLLDRYAAAGVEVHAFPIQSLYGPNTLRQGLRLLRFLRTQRIDVFHSHDKYSNMFAVPWARLAGAKVIASRRWWGGEARSGHRALNRWSYRLSHAVLANSERVGEMVVSREGVARQRVAIIPNFVDAEGFVAPPTEFGSAFRAELNIPRMARLIGSVANLRPVKDQATLLRAFGLLAARWPEVHLVLIGDGESRFALEALARDLNLSDRIHFAGRRPDLPNLNHLFEISVQSSISEGLANSLLEAMAAGRPVVATDVGATADAVAHRETGLLVSRSSPTRMAEAMELLLRDPARARSMGEAGQRRARTDYSAEAALSRLEALYNRLVHPSG